MKLIQILFFQRERLINNLLLKEWEKKIQHKNIDVNIIQSSVIIITNKIIKIILALK